MIQEIAKKPFLYHAPQSAWIKQLEIHTLKNLIRPQDKDILEGGCGKGVNLFALRKWRKDLDLTGFDSDYNSLPTLSINESFKLFRGIDFFVGDVLNKNLLRIYDVVFTCRCLINLKSSKSQKKALLNLWQWVRPGGQLILMENMTENHAYQNKLRQSLGLKSRPVPPFNLFLTEKIRKWFREVVVKDTNTSEHEYNIGNLHDLMLYVMLPLMYPKTHNSPGKWAYKHKLVEAAAKLQMEHGIGQCEHIGQNVAILWKKKRNYHGVC